MNRCGFAFVQDLFCVLVATVAVSLLFVSLISIYVTHQEQERHQQLMEDAKRICDRILRYDQVLHDEQEGFFDQARLDQLDSATLKDGLRIEYGFFVQIEEVTANGSTDARNWTWSSGTPAEDRGVCVTSASVRGSGGGITMARVAMWIWRG